MFKQNMTSESTGNKIPFPLERGHFQSIPAAGAWLAIPQLTAGAWVKLFILFTLLFALLTACSTNQEFAGSVNKNKITLEEYRASVYGGYEAFVSRNNYNPNAQQIRVIQDEVWKTLTQSYALKDLFEKYNVSATYSEVIDSLRVNIPAGFRSNSVFVDEEGRFNSEMYLTSLTTDKPVDMNYARQFYHSTYIPRKKLQKIVLASRAISEKELLKLYNTKYTQADVEFYYFGVDSVKNDPFTITDEDARDYYNSNRETFYVEPTFDLNWVIFDVVATERDRMLTQRLADSLYNEIYYGRRFSILASRYSDQPYARMQGVVGYIDVAELHPEMQRYIRDARENELIPPFYFDNAWWIVKLNDRTEHMVNLNIMKLEDKASAETQKENALKMERFVQLCNRIGFARTADELRLPVYHQSGLSLNNSIIESIGDIANVLRRANNLSEKSILEPMLIPQTNTHVAFQIDRKTTGYYKTLYQAIDQIRQAIFNERKLDLITAKAKDHRNGQTMSGATTKRITLGYSQREGYDYNFLAEVMSSETGHITQVYASGENAYYARVLAKRELDNKPPFSTQTYILKNELQAVDGDAYFQDWLDNQLKKAKVVDKRPKELFAK